MGIRSFIKWSFLWSAALMFLHTVASKSTCDRCKKSITIADLSYGGRTQDNCFYVAFVDKWTECQNIEDQRLLYVSDKTLGVCSLDISTSEIQITFNVTEGNSTFEVISKDFNETLIRFLPNASKHLLPSNMKCVNRTRLQDLSNNISQFTVCQGLTINNISCTWWSPFIRNSNAPVGQDNGRYVLNLENNGNINCYIWTLKPNRNQTAPSEHLSSGSSLSTTFQPNVSNAVYFMENIQNFASSINGTDIKPFQIGSAKGIIIKNINNTSIFTGCDKNGAMMVVNDTSQKTMVWSVKIPEEAFRMAKLQRNETPFVGVVKFQDLLKNISDDGSIMTFKSDFIGISMGVNITNLTETINIYFNQLEMIGDTMICMSWSGTGNWTRSGCNTHTINHTIICACNHLTFFALLMSQPNMSISEADVKSLTYITSIGCGLSTFFLIVGLFIHFVMWRSKTRLGTTLLMNLFVALTLLNITFLSNQQIASLNNNVSCIIIATAMHFSMLATFNWFFIQALHFYLSLTAVKMRIRSYKISVIGIGWGLPAVVVIVVAAFRNYELLTSFQMCWITNTYVHYIVNVGYYALIFILTSIIFTVIVRKITHVRFTKHGIVKTSSRKTAAILSLLSLFGLTWGLAFFGYGAMAIPVYYIFTILNSFQGFFLFLYYYFFRNDDVDLGQSTLDQSLKKTVDESTTTSTIQVSQT